MNQWDRDNLVFFLTADPATLRAWYDQATTVDKDYASTLMLQYSQQLDFRVIMSNDTVEDLSTAKAVLQKFRLTA